MTGPLLFKHGRTHLGLATPTEEFKTKSINLLAFPPRFFWMCRSALQAWLIHKQVATAETVPDLPKQLAFFFFSKLNACVFGGIVHEPWSGVSWIDGVELSRSHLAPLRPRKMYS